MLRNKMAEFRNGVFTQSLERSHRSKGTSHMKKSHKAHHPSSQSWNVSSSSISSAMSCASNETGDDSAEQNIRSKLKKIKKEGKIKHTVRSRKVCLNLGFSGLIYDWYDIAQSAPHEPIDCGFHEILSAAIAKLVQNLGTKK